MDYELFYDDQLKAVKKRGLFTNIGYAISGAVGLVGDGFSAVGEGLDFVADEAIDGVSAVGGLVADGAESLVDMVGLGDEDIEDVVDMCDLCKNVSAKMIKQGVPNTADQTVLKGVIDVPLHMLND